ncbi:twin-arginine translocation pathway signal protein [Azoarcus sp. DD4]|uniref:thiol:disulfide interchange protein DsbA/DsbL n=1 Tax=Azoarcus sp. DD4 TaxID=2027405 RepID=UPI00112C27A0|nr:thiol:disulfide interchange protein DsbA/DsbL [Azoarcus sp. DD4]QDF95495.1 twin-arginine translocation pathway signal protein [Azoarcus sp. DD4]
MNRRIALKQLAALAVLAGPAAQVLAAPASGPYQTLDPAVPTDSKDKLEVIEFFHYGCPHCRAFDPLLEPWVKRLPADVAFVRVPAIWGNAQLARLAQLYYAIEVSGKVDQLHGKVFTAVQDDKVPLHTEDGVREWVAKQGVDVKAFMDAYKSFGVQSMLKRADQVARAYKIQGVPTMAVDGRYLTSASMTGSHEATLKMVDELLGRTRSQPKRG